jgi:hypothetical protein
MAYIQIQNEETEELAEGMIYGVIVQMIYVLSSVYNDCMRPNPQEQRSM